MTTRTLPEIVAVAEMIVADAKADAERLDSKTFTPRGVGETFGEMLAMIAALADGLGSLAEHVEQETAAVRRVRRT